MRKDPLWVFGYGSLIWNPGFAYGESRIATLPGFRRAFCMRSIHHRGTVERPGLVLALDRAEGAQCHGVAFAVPAQAAEETLEYLRARELISAAYLETTQTLRLQTGEAVEAVAYVIDRDHPQYCGALALEEQAAIIARAAGGMGTNRDYLFNTAQHLGELEIGDADLDWLARRVRGLPAD